MICQPHRAADRPHPRRGQESTVRGSGVRALLALPGRGIRPGRAAAELIGDLERIYQRKKPPKELAAATGTTLMSLDGIGPSGAARPLVEAGDITRFPDPSHFASWNGTAPIDASSGDHVRHRLSRAGNRRIDRVLHIMAVVQLCHPTKGRADYDRKVAAGKTPMESMRVLKRKLSDVVSRQVKDDARRLWTGPGGHTARLLTPPRPAHTPAPALRISHSPRDAGARRHFRRHASSQSGKRS